MPVGRPIFVRQHRPQVFNERALDIARAQKSALLDGEPLVSAKGRNHRRGHQRVLAHEERVEGGVLGQAVVFVPRFAQLVALGRQGQAQVSFQGIRIDRP